MPQTSSLTTPDRAFTADCAAGPGPCELISLGSFRDQSGLVGEVTVEQCRRCRVGVSRPPIADVSFLYADRTSPDFQPTSGGLARIIKQIAFKAQARKLLAQAGARPRHVIDFACGSGLFTSVMAQVLGGESKVTGSDFHPTPPADLYGCDYVPMDKLAGYAASADLVTAMHVVEHDDDPASLLARIADLVRPGGTLVIEVPHIDCVWTGVFGKYWDSWYLPYHRIHFSRQSLRVLAERAGLQVVGEHDISIPTMGRTLANLLGLQNGLFFILVSAALQPLQVALERLTGRPSALRLVTRKT